MATIKAGTYRFNDALTAPSAVSEQSIEFQTTPSLIFTDDAVTLGEGSFTWNYIGVAISNTGIGYDGETALTYASDELGGLPVYVDSEGFNLFSNLTGSEAVKGYGQTITIPTDSEVSTEFAEWFSANAAPVVEHTVSGVWKFKDVVDLPSENIVQSVNGTCNVGMTSMGYTGIATIDGIGAIDNTVVTNVTEFNPPNPYITLPRSVVLYQNGAWLTANYGEGINTVDFGTEPQTVSAEFYNWLTANATQPIASVSHNGAEIASLFPGQTATLKCAGMKMAGDVVVSVAELPESGESTGGLVINGIIEQYKVNAGATVNAGDFVEFVKKFGSGSFCNHAPLTPSACQLDSNRVFVVWRTSGNVIYGVLLTIDGESINVGTTTNIGVASKPTTAVALTENKVLVAYGSTYSGSGYGMAKIVTIDGETITAGTEYRYFSGGYANFSSAVALTESKVLVVFRNEGNNNYGVAALLTIDGTTITTAATKTFLSRNVRYTSDGYTSVVALSENKVLVICACINSSGSGSEGQAVVLTIYDTGIVAGTALVFNNSSPCYASMVALTENKVLVAYEDGGNLDYGIAVVLTVDGTTITAGTEAVFNQATTLYISTIALSENKVLVAYQDAKNSYCGTAKVLTIDGTTVTVGEPVVFDDNSCMDKSLVAFSEGSALAVFNSGGSDGCYTGLTIDGTTITSDSEITTYVQPATSRLHNVGIAATGGAGGETVDVYVVG